MNVQILRCLNLSNESASSELMFSASKYSTTIYKWDIAYGRQRRKKISLKLASARAAGVVTMSDAHPLHRSTLQRDREINDFHRYRKYLAEVGIRVQT